MSDQVYFVKMINGEEIITELYRHHSVVVMRNPMQFEQSESDGRRFLYMTRFAPFMREQVMTVADSSVMAMAPVTDEVDRYYRSSVSYCEKVTDETFRKGIASAVQWTHDVLREGDTESEEGEDTVENDPLAFPTSNSIH